MKRPITEFWYRPPGISIKLRRIQTLDQVSHSEQLLAAILRGDALGVEKLVGDEDFLKLFVAFCIETGMTNLVVERLFEYELAHYLDKKIDDTHLSVLNQLRAESKNWSIAHMKTEQQFAAILCLLEPLLDDLLWVKGIHLSRTVYSLPNLRQFGDFDVIVHPKVFAKFIHVLRSNGFQPFNIPAASNQLGSGPVRRGEDLILAPFDEWTPSAVVTMNKPNWAVLDVKVSPLDRGIQSPNLDRFFAEAVRCKCKGRNYLGPKITDHMMILIQNFAKDGFKTGKILFDLHLLALQIGTTPGAWDEFIRQSHREYIATSAWMSLMVTIDRLHTPIPDMVLEQLRPKNLLIAKYLSFTVSPTFVWNNNSLPMLIVNAFASQDRARKLSLLRRSFFPSRQFLHAYYKRSASGWAATTFLLCVHWLVILLPAGLVRRTFGKSYWSQEMLA